MPAIQTSPASLRSAPPASYLGRGGFGHPYRPYLIARQNRKPETPVQQGFSLFPHESEDARITGSTRSLYRRLLALNLHGSLGRPRIHAYTESTFSSVSDVSKIA